MRLYNVYSILVNYEIISYVKNYFFFLIILYLILIESYHCVEFNRTNPLGMKGIMAEEFASLIKLIWSGKFNYINANRLRVSLDRFIL